MKALFRLLRLLAAERPWIAGGLLLALATIIANFGLLALAGWFLAATGLVGLASYAAQNVFNFFTPAAFVRFFATLRVLGRYAGRVVDHEATFRQLAGLRSFLYARLEPLAPGGLAGERSGDLLSRLVADIDRLGDVYLRVFAPFAVAAGASLAMAGALAFFTPWAGIALFAGLALAGLAVPAASLALGARPSREAVALGNTMRADIVDAVQGMAELLTYNAAPAMEARIRAANAQLITREGRLAAVAGLGAGAGLLIANVTMGAALLIGLPLAVTHHLPGADVPLLALGSLAAFEAVAPLPQAFQRLGGMAESARRVFAIADRPPPVREPEVSPKRPARLDIALSNVRLRYARDAPWALDGLSLSIREGEHVTILGRSGAGKTSLVNLLLRFAEYEEGSATLGGIPLKAIRGDDARSLFSVVSQHIHLFAGSIRDNLRIARPDANDDALWRALEAAALAAYVRAVPAGLDQPVGEGAARLSGGEARRLALARAFLRDAPFLVLDEPTEGLDPLTEASLRNDLARLAGGRTVITVTHRLAFVTPEERVVVLESGRVAEDGIFASLRTHGRIVPRLARVQDALTHL
ncbi:MAG TPA: thiol reductant ABC exporter subunit CydC [Acetobacteraceae bacterium]|nr:thiol reductant ABC exporter subunit CydC [Acetobacteraceae bacterium]